jgi:type I restriction enzyme, S subunit
VSPKGWQRIPFTDVFGISGGTQPPKSEFIYEPREDYIRLLQIRDFGEAPVPTYIPDSASLKKCRKDDVLIARYGASLGRILTGHEGAYNVAMARVLIPETFDRRFVMYLLRSDFFQEPLRRFSRSAQNGFNKRDLSSIFLPIAPVEEQERIADELEALLGRVAACRERLHHLPRMLKRFREAVLEAAVSGRLTEEDEIASSKSRDGIPATWLRTPFSDLIESIRTGTTEVPTDNATKFPVLRSSSVRPLSVDIQDRRYLTAQQSTNKENFIQTSDLLFTRLSGSVEYVGNCAMVRTDASESIQYPDRLFRVRLKDPDQARYIEIAFASRSVRKQIEEQVKSSAGHQRISTNAITRAVLRIPPPVDQAEIVRRVDQLFALADVVERQLRKATVQVEKLAPSLLAKAFRGELVPQDPNDEPASVLLARTRKAREEVGATAKHVNRTTTKKVTAERLMPRATRSVKRKPNKVAARSGSPMSQRLVSKRK